MAPSIIFIDEVDALVSRTDSSHDHDASRRFQAELLIQMDGLQEDSDETILVLAASNHPWNVDEAFRRRFEKRIYIPLPDLPAREEMLRLHLVGMKLDNNLQLPKIAKKLDGYSGADVLSVCRQVPQLRD
jgi:katanin p60 ATPase-containing subunit A1